jgi:fibronectin type III domain protein
MPLITWCSSSTRTSLFTATLFSLGIVLMSLVAGCGGGGGTDPSGNALAPPPSGGAPSGGAPSGGGAGSASPTASVSLAWNPDTDPSVYAYFVHYGKQSAGQAGSCTYTYSTYVGSPSATITGLDPQTQYYFAVSAYNGLESTCSNEVTTVTPAAA